MTSLTTHCDMLVTQCTVAGSFPCTAHVSTQIPWHLIPSFPLHRPLTCQSRRTIGCSKLAVKVSKSGGGDRCAMNCKLCPFPSLTQRHKPLAGESRRHRLDARDMADAEALEKISLHTIDDTEESSPTQILTWREKVAVQLKSNKVQYTIIALVVIDSLIVILELLIDMGVIVIPENPTHETATNGSGHFVPNNHDESQIPYNSNLHDGHATLSPSMSMAATETSLNVTNKGGGGAKAEVHTPNKHLAEHILHISSLVILTLFLVEVVIKVVAEGTHLLKHKAEVFDGLVVVVSFTMDITFSFVSVTDATRDYAGLLVLLRLWRVTRIINGVILSVKMDADKKLRAQKALRAKAEEEVQKLTDKVEQLKGENKRLREKITRLEDEFEISQSERSNGTTPLEESKRMCTDNVLDCGFTYVALQLN